MPIADLPLTAFVDPRGNNRAEIEGLFQRVNTALFDHLTNAATKTPLPEPPKPAFTLDDFGHMTDDDIIAHLKTVMDQSMNAATPGYIGHMDSVPSTMSILADTIASAINNNMLSREMSPILSEMEEQLTGMLARWFWGDAAPDARGVMISGGSLGNLQALAVARNIKLPETMSHGLSNITHQPVILASNQAHSSINKAAMMLGLGTDGIVSVKTDANCRMNINDLRIQYALATDNGQRPFAVVATAGTTITGNIDPMPAIADFAAEHDLWLHVDAAYGGALIVSAEHCTRLAGIDRADSITFNPQKWFYSAKTTASVLFRDGPAYIKAFRVVAPYMRDTQSINLGEIGVQGTRRADVLKLWLTLAHLGQNGLETLVRQSFELTTYFINKIRVRPFLWVAGETDMNIICFRGEPDNINPAYYDEWNSALQVKLLQTANIFVSLPTLNEEKWLRVVLLNPYTDESVIDRLFDTIDAHTADA